MDKIKSWLSMKAYKKIRVFIFGTIILLNILLIVIAGTVLFIADKGAYRTPADGMWQIFTDILDPGFLGSVASGASANTVTTCVEVIVILVCMVTFTGAIIGYISNMITSIVDSYESGPKKLYIKNHILILNWNNRAAGIITEYLYTEICEDVVVITSKNRDEVSKEIEDAILSCGYGKNQKHVNVIVKQGEPFSYTELENACAKKARTVIVLSDDDLEYGNIRTLKSVMMISEINRNSKDSNIVVETDNENIYELVRRIQENNTTNIMPVYLNKMLGKLLAHVALQPELNDVFGELFSHDGNEFFSKSLSELDNFNADMDENDIIEEYMMTHDKSIPVTTTRSFVNENSERIFAMASTYSHINSTCSREQDSLNKNIKLKDVFRIPEKNIVILGSNTKTQYIINSFIAYIENYGEEKLSVEFIDTKEKLKNIPEHNSFIKTEISNRYDIFEIRRILDQINMEKIDTIVILSDDNVSATEYDLGALISLIDINKELKNVSDVKKPEVIVEILDPQNHEIVQQYNIDNVIVSNKYISSLVAQLGDDGSIYEVIYDILTFDGEKDIFGNVYSANKESRELYVKRCADLFEEMPVFESTISLVRSIYIASDRKQIPIGIIRADQGEDRLMLFGEELSEKQEVKINPEDRIIVFAHTW